MKRRITLIVVLVGCLMLLGGGAWWYVQRNRGAKLLARAELAMRAGQFDRALGLADSYIGSHPQDWRGHLTKAEAYNRLSKFDEARKALEEAAKLNATEASIRIAIADTYTMPARQMLRGSNGPPASANLAGAIALFKKANDEVLQKIQTGDKKSALNVTQYLGLNHMQIGRAQQQLGDQFAREARLAESADQKEQQAAKRKATQEAFDEADRELAEATKMLLEVLTQDPTRDVAARYAVELSIARGDEASLAAARKAIQSSPDSSPIAVMSLALHELGQGGAPGGPAYRQRVIKVKEDLDGLLKRHPDVTEIRLARARMALFLAGARNAATTAPSADGEAPRPEGELELAGQLLDEILKADPGQAEAQLMRARVASMKGNWSEAESQLNALRTKYPFYLEAQFDYAQAALQNGHAALAEEAMRAITNYAPDRPRESGGGKMGADAAGPSVVARARRYMIESLRRKKFYDQAFQDAQAYFMASPDDPVALQLLVDLARETKHNEVAREALDATRKKYPDRPELLWAAAECYVLLGDNAEAAKVVRETAASKPATPQAKWAVAQAMLQLGKTAEPEALLNEATDQSPSSAKFHFDLAMLYQRSGRPSQALEHLRAAVRLEDRNVAYHAALAHVEFDAGLVDECLADCAEILQQDPSNVAAVLLTNQVKIIQGQPLTVDQALSQPGSQTGLVLASSFLTHGQPDKCVELCQAELSKAPDNPEARALLGQAYFLLGKRDQCLEQWTLLLKASPEKLATYQAIAALLGRDKTPAQVGEALAALPGAKPELVDLALGTILDRQGDYARAADNYKRVLNRPDLSEDLRSRVALLRAQALARTGDLDAAVAEVDKLPPGKPWARQMLLAKAQLLLAAKKQAPADAILADLSRTAVADQDIAVLLAVVRLYLQDRQFDKALATCAQVQQVAPGDARGYSAEAEILAGTGKTQESIEWYRKAIARQPGNLAIHTALAEALVANQEPLQALDVYAKMESLGSTAQAEALFQRAALLARWGLQAQATECLEQLVKAGYEDTPRLQLALGRAFLQLGRTDQARSILEKIPGYANQYVTAQQLLADSADKVDEKLAALDRLEEKRPGQASVLSQRMALLAQAGRAGEAVKCFTAYAEKYAKDKPLPAALLGPALQAMLTVEDRAAAADLAARAAKETAAPQWRALAILLLMDDKPQVATGLMPEVAKAGLFDALLGLVLSAKTAEPAAKWNDRLAEMAKQAAGQTPPVTIPATYLILADLASGATARAKERLAKLDNANFGVVGREVLTEVVASAEGKSAAPAEARMLIKALLAGELGVPRLSREWAMEALKARPTCQWAAAIVLQSGADEATGRQVLEILRPKDCGVARLAQAGLLMGESKFAEAADLYARAAQAEQNNPTLLMSEGAALERAGQFDKALAVYRDVWKATSNAAAANDAAYMISLLSPEAVRQSAEVQTWLDAAGKAAPNDPSFRDTRGWILYLQGKREPALKDLRFAASGRPDSPEIHYHLAVVEAESGNTDFARWHLLAAINLADLQQKRAGKPLPPGPAKAVEAAKQMLAKMETPVT